MTVVKYFHEEPAAWETDAPFPSPDAADAREALEAYLARRRVYRGYLSAAEPDRGISGATGISRPSAWSRPLVEAFADLGWWTALPTADPVRIVEVSDPQRFLETPASRLLLAGMRPPGADAVARCAEALDVPGPDGRAPRLALALDGFVVLWTETAFHGVDWALLAARPTADAVRAALEAGATPDVRSFVIPYREARAEHRFHFDRYDLDGFARYEVGRGQTTQD